MAWVYILHSQKTNNYYIGSTNDLTRRVKEHTSGHSVYTSHILPVSLIFSQQYEYLTQARKIELWLKKQKNKKLIQEIILQGQITKSLS